MFTRFRLIKLLLVLTLCLGLVPSAVFGAACTVAYVWPVAGVTAPTAAQSAVRNSVVADVTCAAADTAVVVTHNLQLANGTGANGLPKVTLTPLAVGTAAVVPFVAFTTANSVTIDKNSTSANTGITVRVTIERPFSPTR